MFGPSFGHWYQGDIWTRGLATRLAGTVAFGVGLSTLDLCIDQHDCPEDDDEALTAALIFGGMAAFAVGTVDDVVSARFAAERRNREHAAKSFQFAIAPRVTNKEAGLTVVGRF